MSEITNALAQTSDPDTIRAYLGEITQTVHQTLYEALLTSQSGGDMQSALGAIDSSVAALREFGEQAIPIIAGQQGMIEEMDEQIGELVEHAETVRSNLDAVVPGLLNAAEMPYGMELVEEAIDSYLYDIIDTDEIVEEHEQSFAQKIEFRINRLRQEGLIAEADELEEQWRASVQTKDALLDAYDRCHTKLMETAKSKPGWVEEHNRLMNAVDALEDEDEDDLDFDEIAYVTDDSEDEGEAF